MKLINKCFVCVVLITENTGKTYIFGVYDNEELARKRVDELDFCIGEDCVAIRYINDVVWGASE